MRRFWRQSLFALGCLMCGALAQAHDLPLSYLDLRLTNEGIDAQIESSAKNFARALGGIDEAQLLESASLRQLPEQLLAAINAGLTIQADGKIIPAELRAVEPLPARKDLRLRLHYSGGGSLETLKIRCALFAADSRHKTFLNLYRGDTLSFQGIFDQKTAQIDYRLGEKQSALTVVRQFLLEGIHHIFIGPDHILFIVGLLLLGGTLGQLLKIVTAFTIAHSVTLVLATLNILSPPARLIEPLIALSIIFVGAHALLVGGKVRDWRLLFAFSFGFIHGFGFANVLREMHLPRAALGWSLFSFNAGVEIGQACIVVAIAPALALLYRRKPATARRVVTAAAFGVVFAGSFWLTERLF